MSAVMDLMRALRASLTPVLATLPLPVRNRETDMRPVPLLDGAHVVPEELRPARIFLGRTPPTANDALGCVPFVVLQPLDGEDGEGLHRLRLALRVCVAAGTFDEAEDAEADVHNLLSLLRRHLLSLPDGLLTPRFRIVRNDKDLPWTRPDEQFPPFVQAYIISSWEMQGVSHVAV